MTKTPARVATVIAIFSLAVTGCAAPSSMMPKEIDPAQVPAGLWEKYQVVVPNVEAPSFSSQRLPNYLARTNDCPETRIAVRTIPNAVCKEARVRDTERGCDMVFSTFGEGLCPTAGDDYAQKMNQLEAIRLAGDAVRTAVANSMLQKVVRDSVLAQQEGADFLSKYRMSELLGPEVQTKNGTRVTETVIPTSPSFVPGTIIASTRSGFYTDCIKPNFNSAAVMEFNQTYIRILSDELLCKTSSTNDNYRGSYLNSKMSNGQSWVLDLTLNDANDSATLCVNDYYGNCRFEKKNLVAGSDFTYVRGFIQDLGVTDRAAILSKVEGGEATVMITAQDENGTPDMVILTPEMPHAVRGGISLRLTGVAEGNSVPLSIEGSF